MFTQDLLKETSILGCKLVDAAIKSNHRLREKNEESMVNKGIYQRMEGKLIIYHVRTYIAYVGIVMS